MNHGWYPDAAYREPYDRLCQAIAKQAEEQGKNRFEAAVEGARTRLRPILMTSLAFILGVVPLVIASGAGAEMRQSLGTAVFSGMLGVTFFGLIFTPMFYVVCRGIATMGPVNWPGRKAKTGAIIETRWKRLDLDAARRSHGPSATEPYLDTLA